MRSRPVRAAVLLLAAFLTLAVGMGILELIFGLWVRHNPWDRALALNIVVNRTIAYDASNLYQGGGTVTYTRDRYGLRGSYGGDPKDITILTVGGSTTDQRYISDGLTWQDELEWRLRAAGQDVRVANAGIDGHSAFAHLASYEYWFPLIPNLRPKYTLLYIGINDFLLDGPSPTFEGTLGSPTLKSRIKANSAFYRLYSMIRGSILARRVRLTHAGIDFSKVPYTDTPLLSDHKVVGTNRLRAFEGRFRELLRRTREGGSIPVCVPPPTAHYRRTEGGTVLGIAQPIRFSGVPGGFINGVDYFYLRRARIAAMRALCDAAGSPTIDLASQDWDTADFYDEVHMTPAGAKKVGQRIASSMKAFPF